jgi:F0F1-type ATP synthase epsilon subunit
MNGDAFFLLVRSRDKIIYQGEASSVSSVNERGKFDILPQHSNFISLVKDYLIIRGKDGKSTEIKIDNGIIRVHKDKVDIYIGIKRSFENKKVKSIGKSV